VQRYYDYVLNENGRGVAYGDAPADYSTSVLTAKAVQFLRRVQQPFFLYFAPLAPHLPATPPPGAGTALLPLRRMPPSFNEADVADKPWRALHARRLRPGAVDFLEREIVARQIEARQALDRSVRDVVATLKERHLLGSTIILYASDNGFLWGEHRLGGKVWPYEESIRVPLVVRTPWDVGPRVDDRLVLNIDLASTIAELAEVTPGLPQDGRSLVPLLRGESPAWRDDFVIEYLGRSLLGQGGPPPYVGIRTRRYVYVAYANGWRELYDLGRDPWELRNVATDPAHELVRFRLERRLHTLYGQEPG
jgi:arylsulfatase A-like enzyme